MANLTVKELGLANPVIIASSPATHGVKAVLKSAAARPGAVVMRNYGHGAGGGTLVLPSVSALRAGRDAIQVHAIGTTTRDPFSSFEEYCHAIAQVRREMPQEVKLWVSLGHIGDTAYAGWERTWTEQAMEIERAGADALELHLNTPGVAVARNRTFDFYRLVYNTTKMIKDVAKIPVMVKLPVECCDPLRAMEAAQHAGADAVGPTARWRGFVFDLEWQRSPGRPGGGYGGTQMLPIICYTVAEARRSGMDLPMFAGGGVFTWKAAAKLIMAGSQCVQLGSLACCVGPRAVASLIKGLDKWMDEKGYPDINSLCGEALKLFEMPGDVAGERGKRLGAAYREAAVDAGLCNGCGMCVDVCWHDALALKEGMAVKRENCIGCGYCFQVCPTGALKANTGEVLSSVFETRGGAASGNG